jgi:hypothetical protein
MQNEPNFRKSQMNVNKVLTMNYEKLDTWSSGKNEPKTNPNEPNSKPIQTQPVESLSALSAVEGVEPISEAEKAAGVIHFNLFHARAQALADCLDRSRRFGGSLFLTRNE